MNERKRVIIFFGLIASGKSYLATRWAKGKGYPYYNSDVVRKELAGLKPETSQRKGVGEGIYTSTFSRKTYDELLRRVQVALDSGEHECVVLDGSYQSRAERDRVCNALKEHAALFVYCRCPESVMKMRMEQREQDPKAISDGRWEIYLKQKECFEYPVELSPRQLLILDTDNDVEEVLNQIDTAVKG